MAKYFTIKEAKISLRKMNLPSQVRQKVLEELRSRGGYAISPTELRAITKRMMWERKDQISTAQAWRVRKELKKKF